MPVKILLPGFLCITIVMNGFTESWIFYMNRTF